MAEGQLNQGDNISTESPQIVASSNIEGKISELDKLITQVKAIFTVERKAIENNVLIWAGITVFLIIALVAFYWLYLFNICFPHDWTWQIGYEAAVRITCITLWVSAITFCLKMLKSYLSLLETTRHKIAILKSMPILVNASGEDYEQFRTAYNKIFDMLVNLNKSSFENLVDLNDNTIELLKKLLDKK